MTMFGDTLIFVEPFRGFSLVRQHKTLCNVEDEGVANEIRDALNAKNRAADHIAELERQIAELDRDDYAKCIAEAVREAAGAAISQHDKAGREWIKGSLWDTLSNEASARIRSLDLDAIIASVPTDEWIRENPAVPGWYETKRDRDGLEIELWWSGHAWRASPNSPQHTYLENDRSHRPPQPKESHEQD